MGPKGNQNSVCFIIKLDFKPNDHSTAIVKIKSMLELWGIRATTNLGRFGNSPLMRQPMVLSVNRPMTRVNGL
jgi:hypothetical protein